MDQTKRQRRRSSDRVEAGGSGPGEDGGSELLREATRWAGVARESNEECKKGAEAEKEVHRRRNRPGQ